MTGLQKTKGNNSNFFTIPSDQDFLKILANYLLNKNTQYQLAQYIIFLPTQRACKKLEEDLLNASKDGAVLLPRMIPLGQVEEDEITLSGIEESEFGVNLPALVSNEKRQIILTKIISKFYQDQGNPILTSKASSLAIQLAQLIDQIEMEGLDLKTLETLSDQNYAEHWQTTLDFLKIIKDFWPSILANENVIEFKKFHRLLVEKLIEKWQQTPPENPIIIAGSTGSIPSTAGLIKVVSQLNNGCIILPGLDLFMDHIPEASHPQNTLFKLLESVNLSPENVLPFPGCIESLQHNFLCSIFNNKPTHIENFSNVQYVDCAHEQEEAAVVSTIVRKHLETPNKTIQVITPDRNLAERIINELNKWKIKTNDSGGKPLRRMPLGSFVLQTANWINPNLSAVNFLATLKHPYVQKYKFIAQTLERYYFRNKNTPALPYQLDENLDDVLNKVPSQFHHDLRDFIAELSYIKKKVMTLSKDAILSDFMEVHQILMEWLTEDTFDSFETMGSGSETHPFNQLWKNIYQESSAFTLSNAEDYGPFLESFLLQIKVRPHKSLHPRIHILGLIESRLMRSDVVILAGLNEGVWPPEPVTDPWFNQSMRVQFGLPSHERRIGLSCLDFIHACGNKKVFLTRSCRTNGTPTIPSRFLLKLKSGLKNSNITLSQCSEFLDFVRFQSSQIHAEPILAPEPKPLVEKRPRKLSVTEIEVLLKDPYAIYAKHVLNLKPLNDLDMEPGDKEFGILIHKIFQLTVKKTSFNLQNIFEETFRNSPHKYLWWIRTQRAQDWFLEEMKSISPEKIYTEVYGELTFQSLGGPFTLKGIADRIDKNKNCADILDYKTGTLPLPKNIRNGQSAQLPLEGIILKEGGFKNVDPLNISNLIFWHVTGKENKGYILPIKDDLEKLLNETYKGLKSLINQFDQADTPYRSHPHGIEGYGAYNHLARIKEWIN